MRPGPCLAMLRSWVLRPTRTVRLYAHRRQRQKDAKRARQTRLGERCDKQGKLARERPRDVDGRVRDGAGVRGGGCACARFRRGFRGGELVLGVCAALVVAEVADFALDAAGGNGNEARVKKGARGRGKGTSGGGSQSGWDGGTGRDGRGHED